MQHVKRTLRWVVTAAYAGFVFYLSIIALGKNAVPPHLDKVYHAVAYSGLCILCIWALRSTIMRKSRWTPLVGALITIGYGICMEITQINVPYRNAEVGDAIANAVGAFAAIPLSMLLIGVRDRVKKTI